MSLVEIENGQLTGRVYSKSSQPKTTNHQSKENLFQLFATIFKEIFLPTGYPHTVSNDYLAYQIWDTIQAFASSITNALAFSAILEGMGVGDEKASVLSATFVWLIKDGVGMLGRIVFAWFHGTGLDSNLKMWRFYADILNDLATSLDLIAPFFKQFLLPISCLSNLCRSLVGVAGGSTRAALTQHQAIAHNTGDVSAKDGSQETLVNLLALIVNLILLQTIKNDRILVWSLYFLLTFVHLYANYRAIRSLQLRTFNWNRFVILCEQFFRFRSVQTIEYVNRTEPILREIQQTISCQVGKQFQRYQIDTIDIDQFAQYRFSIYFDSKSSSTFQVFLTDTCTDKDLIQCYFFLQYLIYHDKTIDEYQTSSNWIDIHRLNAMISKIYDEFLLKAQGQNWHIDQAKFLTGHFRYRTKFSL